MSSDEIASYLESNGWKRATAGETVFGSAVGSVALMIETGLGLIVSGEYGVGKSTLATLVARGFRSPVFKVNLAVVDELRKLTRSYLEFNCEEPWTKTVLLDDLGAEHPVNEYGVRLETAGDFIVKYHALREPGSRLIITTNLTTSELDERYGGRVLSRLKDLCVPLRLEGGDKRRWTLP